MPNDFDTIVNSAAAEADIGTINVMIITHDYLTLLIAVDLGSMHSVDDGLVA
jgi:hypothetical protein